MGREGNLFAWRTQNTYIHALHVATFLLFPPLWKEKKNAGKKLRVRLREFVEIRARVSPELLLESGACPSFARVAIGKRREMDQGFRIACTISGWTWKQVLGDFYN